MDVQTNYFDCFVWKFWREKDADTEQQSKLKELEMEINIKGEINKMENTIKKINKGKSSFCEKLNKLKIINMTARLLLICGSWQKMFIISEQSKNLWDLSEISSRAQRRI